jgi:hypothetical protein
LPSDTIPTWKNVLADLKHANVPLQRIDGHAIAFYVLCITQTQAAVLAGDTKLSARLYRDAIAWSGLIGATPASRARLSIKPAPKPVEDEWDKLDAMRPPQGAA